MNYVRIHFYTTEGFTQAPNGNNVENCQVLGRALGKILKKQGAISSKKILGLKRLDSTWKTCL